MDVDNEVKNEMMQQYILDFECTSRYERIGHIYKSLLVDEFEAHDQS